MNVTRILGIFIGTGAMILSIFVEGGQLQSYVNIGALLIIFGGCTGAVLISHGGASFQKMPLHLKRAFSSPNILPVDETAALLKEVAAIIRKEGILAASKKVDGLTHPFLKQGMQMVIDGVAAEKIENTLYTYLSNIKRDQQDGIRIFMSFGGFAPTMGIIGTVLGLVNMLINLGALGSEGLGHAVAVAFIATLYGIGFANLICIPIANALTERMEAEVNFNKALIDSILLIQLGESPRVVELRFYENNSIF